MNYAPTPHASENLYLLCGQAAQLRVHRGMLAGLRGIVPGGITVRDFEAVTGANHRDSKKILDAFVAGGIGTRQDAGDNDGHNSNDDDYDVDYDDNGNSNGSRNSNNNSSNNDDGDAAPSPPPDVTFSNDCAGGLAPRGAATTYHFADGDRLRAAIALLEGGLAIDDISEALDWRDFEGLTAAILSSQGFAVIRNLVLTKPRMEIDVVGIRLGIAVLIDCKHWRRSGGSALAGAVDRQIERTRHYVASTPGAVAVPAIVTLYRDGVDFVRNVPVVPIFQFASFVDEFYGNIDLMKTIGTG